VASIVDRLRELELDVVPGHMSPGLGGQRRQGFSGAEPELGGGRRVNEQVWRAMLEPFRPRNRALLLSLPDDTLRAYVVYLKKVLDPHQTRIERVPDGRKPAAFYTVDERVSGALLLGAIGGSGVYETLLQVLEEDDMGPVRIAAARALAGLQEQGVERALTEAFPRERDPLVRAGIIRALALLPEPDVTQLIDMLVATLERDTYPGVVQAAQEALATLAVNVRHRSIVVRTLMRLARTSRVPATRAQLIQVLGKLDAREAHALVLSALDDYAPEVQQAAWRALGELWEIAAVGRLGSDSQEIRFAAVHDLERLALSDQRATTALVQLAQFSRDVIGSVAREILHKVGWQEALDISETYRAAVARVARDVETE
jgi:HEAT repeat protein